MGCTNICRSLAELEDALRRAQSALVELKTRFDTSNIDVAWRVPLLCLKGTNVRSLAIIHFPSCGAEFLEELSRNLDFTSLQDLHMYIPAIQGEERLLPVLLHIVQRSAPQLTKLSSSIKLFKAILREEFRPQLQLQNLFIISDLFDSSLDPSGHFSIYLNLRALSLDDLSFLSCATPNLTFPQLESLSIECAYGHLRKFNLPSLKILTLGSIDDGECTCNPPDIRYTLSLVFPSMTYISISAQVPDTHWIRRIQSTSLVASVLLEVGK
ncbi:hypothetical protein PIIN_07772 [Serendipita indica DSM 11827]|uniref:F-box domain-containing protein n=1 Tax=Serendipita indica (strain DSM 11827) TaxID=1109443 RepID=G4TR75_SERID|nr:hypothetical protein PIIN_07772 [Serendipita indica DSM 11827]